MASVGNLLALNDPDPKEMSIVDHLEELRQRLVICIVTVMLGAVVGWFFVKPIFDLLVWPLSGYKNVSLILNSLTDGFVIKLKISVAVGVALGLPVLLYQVWMFVAPAVSLRARRYAVPFVLIGIVLFMIGATIGYFVFPRVVAFLVGQASDLHDVKQLVTIANYVGQFSLVVIIFGAVFELPVVLTFLAMIGLVSSRFLRAQRRVAAMIGLVSAMIITPGADPITPFITAGVVYLLYESSIIAVRLIHR